MFHSAVDIRRPDISVYRFLSPSTSRLLCAERTVFSVPWLPDRDENQRSDDWHHNNVQNRGIPIPSGPAHLFSAGTVVSSVRSASAERVHH